MEPNVDRSNGPATKKCRVKVILGIESFAKCQEPDSDSCSYARQIGEAILCYHPDWRQMVCTDEAGWANPVE